MLLDRRYLGIDEKIITSLVNLTLLVLKILYEQSSHEGGLEFNNVLGA